MRISNLVTKHRDDPYEDGLTYFAIWVSFSKVNIVVQSWNLWLTVQPWNIHGYLNLAGHIFYRNFNFVAKTGIAQRGRSFHCNPLLSRLTCAHWLTPSSCCKGLKTWVLQSMYVYVWNDHREMTLMDQSAKDTEVDTRLNTWTALWSSRSSNITKSKKINCTRKMVLYEKSTNIILSINVYACGDARSKCNL